MASARTPFWLSIFASLFALCFVRVNTSACSTPSSPSRWSSKSFFWCVSTYRRCWSTVSGALAWVATSTFCGLVRNSFVSFSTCVLIVALKSMVCLLLGVLLTIFFMSGMKPISSMRSASSRMSISTSSNLRCCCWIKSRSRPGVATTKSTPCLSACTCGFCPTPP